MTREVRTEVRVFEVRLMCECGGAVCSSVVRAHAEMTWYENRCVANCPRSSTTRS